ncbi:hypothetical protein K402DRAFT_392338 [Aulographum hederae CBS 113979]|uniref:Cupin type-2 domain-containing protein n=1 Tax=Aulographum hederae CBS 113979 TaxID=1176131 RepID=A0A6G1H4S9_9PEZI|nr:hypothetical protein K402DRAFT_392338 [Aulographum hederae CBS 113979]
MRSVSVLYRQIEARSFSSSSKPVYPHFTCLSVLSDHLHEISSLSESLITPPDSPFPRRIRGEEETENEKLPLNSKQVNELHIITMSTLATAPPALPKRYITTHDPKTGLSILSSHDSTPPTSTIPPNSSTPAAIFTLDYTTAALPVPLTADKDLDAYTADTAASPPLPPHYTTSNGTVVRHTMTAPGGVSPMHRTRSCDYMVVIEGECELILDGGERTRLGRGDLVVQRGTMHAWRNCSKTDWLVMVAIMMPADQVEVGGEKLDAEFRAPPAVE